jgi:hypothetical protein
VCGTIDVESANLNAFDSKTQTLLEECANLLSELGLLENNGLLPSVALAQGGTPKVRN